MSVDVHTLSGAYALNAVNDLERVAFDRHLNECDTCAQEVGELVDTVTRLTDTTWSVAPPALREKVLREVGQTRQAPPRRRAAAANQRRWRTWAGSVAAAAVLVVASATGTYLLQGDREGGEGDRLAAIERVLAASDTRLARGDVPRGGTVSVAASRQENAAVVTMAQVREPLPDKCYTFWRMVDGVPARAGLLDPGQADGMLLIPEIRDAQMVAVTEESCAAPPDRPSMNPIAAVAI